MKKYLLIISLLLPVSSHAMEWVRDGKLSKEAVKALSLLGIIVPLNLNESCELFQKHYFKDWKEIAQGKAVLDIEGHQISQEKLGSFLEYIDQNTLTDTVEGLEIPRDTIAIIPSASMDQKTNAYLFSLLKNYITSVNEVIVFTKDEASRDMVSSLFSDTFKGFKNLKCMIASDKGNVAQSCALELRDAWKNSSDKPIYMIVSHWAPFNSSVKSILQVDYEDGYIGSELQPIPWKDAVKMYGNGRNGVASTKLREAAVAFFNANNNRE